MLAALTLLLACQLAGEIIVRALGLPLPGPVMGLLLLSAGLLLARRRFPDLTGTGLERLASMILGSLGLLFIPAGVGVVGQLDLLASYWPAIATTLLLSTVLTLLATVGTFLLVKRIVP